MNDLIDKVALIDALAKRVPYVIDTPDTLRRGKQYDEKPTWTGDM